MEKQGFASNTEYQEHLAKEKGFASLIEYQKHLAKQKGFASYTEYYKQIKKKQLCESLSNIVSETKDPESLFNDIEFVRKITGCKVPIPKKKKNDNI